ncbi:MAG TPA: hypothetical protein VGP99_11770, partial [Tepidisphaeraceae bacterium]|nr:hypothetical protein [Tepidisphaeraceae bacterium]
IYHKNGIILVLAAIILEFLSLFTLFILTGPLSGGIWLMTIIALLSVDKKVDIGLMFSQFRRFGPLVGLFFLTTIPILLGLLLFIVPGILLMALWMYSFPLLIERNMSITEAMTASWRIVLRNGLGWNLLLAAIIFAFAIVPTFIPYLGLIVAWFLAPITWLMASSAYIQQVRERESELADILSPRGFPVQPNPATT